MNTKSNPITEKEAKINSTETAQNQQDQQNQHEASANAETNGSETSNLTPEEMLQQEIAKMKDEIAAANDKYVRLMAEFENFRRNKAKERLDLIASAGKDIIEGILPTLDDCERALKVLKESDAAQSAIEGTELIYNKLEGYLRSKGVAKIEAVGKQFDTDFHEAVAQIPAQEEKQKNLVIDIVQQGYTLNGKVIRFAKVVVAM